MLNGLFLNKLRPTDSKDENFYSRISDNDWGSWMLCQAFLDSDRALLNKVTLINWDLLRAVTWVLLYL